MTVTILDGDAVAKQVIALGLLRAGDWFINEEVLGCVVAVYVRPKEITALVMSDGMRAWVSYYRDDLLVTPVDTEIAIKFNRRQQ